MNKKLFFGALAFASFGMVACSEDENIPEVNTPNEEIEVQNGFKALTQINFESILGTAKGASAESRTMADVDDLYRPTQNYYLPYVYMLRTEPLKQPTPDDEDRVVDFGYNGRQSQACRHDFRFNQYQLDYRLGDDIVSNEDMEASYSGSITLRHGTDEMTFRLSVFKTEDLHKKEIRLNHFAYDVASKKNIAVKGSSLRYVSYNPFDLKHEGSTVANAKGQNDQELKDQFVELPQLTEYDGAEYDLLKQTFPISKNLVSECKDQYFSGSEFLIAADKEAVYLLKVVNQENENGGFFEVRRYTDLPAGKADPDYLSMNRLTTMINASFMLVPEEGQPEYFVRNNEAQTLKNFKNLYNVDLSTLACPYATIDGVNTHFHLNNYKAQQATHNRGRLALWAKGHEVIAANNHAYNKQPRRSMDIEYHHGGKHQVTRSGYGIEGRSYTVAFPGSDKDTEGQSINFWVEVAGQQIRINAPIDDNAGIAFSSNCSHNIIVFIPAKAFADAVNNPATRSNGYAELNLNSGCVVAE